MSTNNFYCNNFAVYYNNYNIFLIICKNRNYYFANQIEIITFNKMAIIFVNLTETV